MLYMIIERFAGGDPVPVYRRLQDLGRLAPPGLDYLGSWVTKDLRSCFQLMACGNRALIDQWMASWSDLVEFEVIPVLTSAEAVAAVADRL